MTPNSRSYLNRWTQPDSIIPDPGNPLDWDRFQYVRSNPLKYTDPSGLTQACADGDEGGDCGRGSNSNEVFRAFAASGKHKGMFAEYYAAKHVYNQESARVMAQVSDPREYANAQTYLKPFVGTYTMAWAHAMAYVPQSDYGPLVAASPESLVNGAKLLVQMGKEGLEFAGGLVLGSTNSSSSPLSGSITGTNYVWPSTPQAMDHFLGVPGTSIPDGPTTPGRNKVIWNPASNITITYEQHPYYPNAPREHSGPHWHISYPGVDHARFLAGDLMP